MYVNLILYSDRNVIPTNNKYRNNVYVYALFEGREIGSFCGLKY